MQPGMEIGKMTRELFRRRSRPGMHRKMFVDAQGAWTYANMICRGEMAIDEAEPFAPVSSFNTPARVRDPA